MSNIAIRVENLSKQYRIGERESYKALRDVIADAAAAPFRRVKSAFNGNGSSNGSALSTQHPARKTPNSIWALDDVSFEVKQGEVVGIIGRNGAGKSTLLKILSRITKPTKGHAKIYGRVGSLLEVGTGFHPELTGRENIYLNGAILGMRKAEIERKFDEIVAFAEVEKFIDTPVKRYSSGMYVRLAFAVAAHMETEVLIVDEVLAVGDREFQKKCLGKLDDVSHAGRTVILVSHQMNQIRQLANRAIWLEAGRLKQLGKSATVVSEYESSAFARSAQSMTNHCFQFWKLKDGGNVITDGLQSVSICIGLQSSQRIVNGHLGIAILNTDKTVLAGWGFDNLIVEAGVTEIVLDLPSLPLKAGSYELLFSLFSDGNNLNGGVQMDRWYANPPLLIESSRFAHPQDDWSGVVNIPGSLIQNRL